jgi:biotin operon repressor
MNTIAGVYASHEKAIEAVQELKRAGYPVEQVSLIGKAVIIDDLMHVRHNRWIKNTPAIIGAILGPILGILTGVKLFAIPGLRFLFGTGAGLGALAGFSLGIAGGGVISLIATLIIKRRDVLKYHEHLEEKGFQVIAHGTNEEGNKAKEILEKIQITQTTF